MSLEFVSLVFGGFRGGAAGSFFLEAWRERVVFELGFYCFCIVDGLCLKVGKVWKDGWGNIWWR